MKIKSLLTRKKILITGRVQGVGFRPAVYKLAKELGLSGFILNDTKGVTIELQGQEKSISEFLDRLQSNDKPPLAEIRSCKAIHINPRDDENSFTIASSNNTGTALSEVSADMAVCPACLREMRDSGDFRYRYPFINCTNCGPRYSIIKTIPYDRPNTTMSIFQMCRNCSEQYKDVTDRRFHAQPVACPKCGPEIYLTDKKGNTIESISDSVIAKTVGLLKQGKIAAIKGIGGFHLAVDALNNKAVQRLRRRKRRDHKPFALMSDSIKKIKRHAFVDKPAEKTLASPQSPIVLLPKKPDSKIATSVAQGVDTFGFMLCYAPLHNLIFEQGPEVLVMTSGNISEEPLICDNGQALDKLGDIADVFLMHNRDIYRRIDDSIVHLIDNKPALLRRARGYVPTPITSPQSSRVDIFAAGADLKNTFCFVKQNQIICSEHIGDLEDARTYRHYKESIQHLGNLFEIEPEVTACDLHPGYLSTAYAHSSKNRKIIHVQHHWAHIASVLAENNTAGPVIGLSCDGTGYGTDETIWGCECMVASLEDFQRIGHLQCFPLPGADKAAKEAVRPLLGLLKLTFGEDIDPQQLQHLLDGIEPDREKQKIIAGQIDKYINTVKTSSLGRVFDAVAALLGLGNYNHFEGQLPMALESIIDRNNSDCYDFELIAGDNEPLILDLRKMIVQLIKDIEKKTATGKISAKFHNCIEQGLLETAKKARASNELNTVALGGGVFCNRYLSDRLIKHLKENDFEVLFNENFPPNDGGIALGQAAIAVHKIKKKES